MTTEPTEGTPVDQRTDRARQRQELLREHQAARARREASALGSDDYRAAAEEIARIEVQINRLEEPESAD